MDEKFIQAGKMIEKAQKVLVISHKRPDGDTLGAASAMYLALKEMGKDVKIACIDKIPERFDFIPEMNRMIRDFDFREFELMLVLDAGASYMTKYHDIYPDIWSGGVPVINIDHHASNDNFGTCNIVDPNAASTTLIMYKMFNFLGLEINPRMATALLTGIYNDTGSLMHSNTNLDVFEICEKLVAKGAKLSIIAKKLFKNNPVSTLKLWGRAMENARINDEGATISIVTWKDIEECGASPEEVSGVVDMLNSVPGTKYTCLLNEDKHGNIKGSFRTQRDDVDVAELAARFGGGGHKKAAGFSMPGKIHKEEHWKIIPSQELPEGKLLPKIV
jgi:phosphoesterase RecJ-like protein